MSFFRKFAEILVDSPFIKEKFDEIIEFLAEF
ncbi:hypothetical protein DesLBE_2387 [Desulfitobacterium sp. LBE]|nr:hypothetical protein DesLBE_2387 [Desulfitobacterium sp. LBE]